jgi:acetate kinase
LAGAVVKVLLLNAGSSSLKCTLMESEGRAVVGRASADWAGQVTRYACSVSNAGNVSEEVAWRGHAEAVRRALGDLVPKGGRSAGLAAVGHRMVHGGEFQTSVRIAPEIRSRIAALAELAPLHNPPGLETLAAAEAELPAVAHVAVFDTAFHASLPPAARTYPVPEAWTRGWGIRRYGFHGLSHAYCAGRAAAMLARPVAELRLVICHLGHGCSATAVSRGRSLDTTMGFTPLDGLMMATRSGSLDPGIVLHVQRRHGLAASDVEEALNQASGLLGVSGISGDMREVLASARAGNGRAQLALDVYTHRVRQAVGALAVTLGGVDALVFTAGVGENSAEVRAASCRGLACLGLELDEESNATCRPDADVARPGSPARILVIATREELSMLDEVMRVIGTRVPRGPAIRSDATPTEVS